MQNFNIEELPEVPAEDAIMHLIDELKEIPDEVGRYSKEA